MIREPRQVIGLWLTGVAILVIIALVRWVVWLVS